MRREHKRLLRDKTEQSIHRKPAHSQHGSGAHAPPDVLVNGGVAQLTWILSGCFFFVLFFENHNEMHLIKTV